MTAPQEPLFDYSRSGFSFKVYPNRVEVRERKIIAFKDTAILMRNIAQVETKVGKVVISTNDGAKHEYIIGTKAAEAARAILDQL